MPAHLHSQPVVVVAVCDVGCLDEGERVLAPLWSFGAPLLDTIGPTPYTTHQGMFDASVPHGLHYY